MHRISHGIKVRIFYKLYPWHKSSAYLGYKVNIFWWLTKINGYYIDFKSSIYAIKIWHQYLY